ncbi:Voltage-gated potassium channel Kch [Posidoniimonas polymericola]|uniref:Voltage-gated potassium channel Kch n=1 Tax=Posidoniimonas polymericola TaxID=2528002 RepID=A0A5C5YMB5_9BACT|nr:potassium channel protein [Posidoniimonas polymericola]TWT75898.1 Voltage-gated potassium channel Kch [Posidoniimonas polymericola]
MLLRTPTTSIARCISLLAGVLLVGTVGFYHIEGKWTLWECLYFTLVTITTVGYGDYGLSHNGQVFASLLLVCGISVFTYSLTTIVQIASDPEASRKRIMRRRIADCSDHIIVCGYGRMGRTICEEITREGVTCVVIENNESSIRRAVEDGLVVLEGEASDDELLLAAGLERARGVICAVDSDAENMFITVTVREHNPNCYIISRAENEMAARKLQHAGASLVVSPHQMAGRTVASAVICPRLAKYTNGYDDDDQSFRLGETHIKPGAPLVGQSVSEFGGTVDGLVFVAIERANGLTILRPRGSEVFQQDDIVIYAGGHDDIAAIKNAALSPALCRL